MRRTSWTSAAPRVYDALMWPLESLALEEWRAGMWATVPRHGRGLEIGAGTGAGAAHRPPGASVVVIDIGWSVLARQRERANGALPRAAVADVQALPFAAGAFDWAVASLVFCEVAYPLAGLRELRRVIRPGGSLHLLEHVEPRTRAGAALARALTRVTGPRFGEHFDRRTHETVEAAGFTRERTDWGFGGTLVRVVAR